jgi:negative regulator of flagellin synthesis FlgM
MDIERVSQRQIDPAVTGLGSARRAERTGNESGVKADQQGVQPAASDTVEISSHARDLTRARQAVDDVPDVRADRVAQIKKSIEDGTYSVSPALLAKKMLGIDG